MLKHIHTAEVINLFFHALNNLLFPSHPWGIILKDASLYQSRVANTHISVAEDCGVTEMFQVWSFKEECCHKRGVPCLKHKIIYPRTRWKKLAPSLNDLLIVLQLRVTEPGSGASSPDLGWQAGLGLPARRFQHPQGMKFGVCHSQSLGLGDQHWPVWFSWTRTCAHKATCAHFILYISKLKSITKISALIIFECICH